MKEAVLGLGSNLGESIDTLKNAIKAIGLLPRTQVLGCSRLYRTAPFGENTQGQPDYVNCCVKVQTGLQAETLLGGCLGIEAAFGRRRSYQNAPRALDIDLLLYGDEKIDAADVVVPHPRMLGRAFVLVPLLDLYPDGTAPGLNFLEAISQVDKAGVSVLEESFNKDR